jgi:tetratricopeptide (TPR) repeat protein
MYNFHRRREEEQVDAFLAAPTVRGKFLLLVGPEGIGRTYLLEAAVRRQRGIRLLTVDAGTWEDDNAAEILAAESAGLERRIGKEDEAATPIDSHLEVAISDLGSIGAFLASVVVSLPIPLALLARLLESKDTSLAGPSRKPRDALARVLDEACRSGPLLLHVRHGHEVSATLHRWLTDECLTRDSLILAFSWPTGESEASINRARLKAHRIELTPLSERELRNTVFRRFHPNGFTSRTFSALYIKSKGWPALVAASLWDLVRSGSVYTDDTGTWLSRHDRVEDVRLFAPEILEAIDAAGQTISALVELIALCGIAAPVEPLLRFLGVEERQQQDDIIDALDEALSDASPTPLLTDYGYGHPSFRGLLTYGFANPVIRQVLLSRVLPDRRAEQSLALLKFLSPRQPRAETRGRTRILLELARHSDPQAAASLSADLRWWVSRSESDSLSEIVRDDLLTGRALPGSLLQLIHSSQSRWPPHRLLALIDGVLRSGVAPNDMMFELHCLRAETLCDEGRYEEAIADAEQARLELISEDSMSAIRVYAVLGRARRMAAQTLADLQEAAANYMRAYNLAARLMQPDDRRFAIIADNLGVLLDHVGFPERAVPFHRVACRIFEQSNKADWVTSALNLAVALKHFGAHEVEEARQLLEQARTAIENSEVDSPLRRAPYAIVLDTLGSVYRRLGQVDRSLECHNRALELLTTLLGPDSRDVAVCLGNLSSLYLSTGDPRNARELAEAAVRILTHQSGETIDLATALVDLAHSVSLLGEDRQAISLLDRAVAIHRRLFGSSHLSIAGLLDTKAQLLDALGESGQAEDCRRLAQEIYDRWKAAWDSPPGGPASLP